MKFLKILFLILAMALTLNNVMIAQDNGDDGQRSGVQTTAVPFLLLAPDSRAGGMGESGTGLADNSSAIFWNPGGVAFLTGTEIGFTHSNWLPQFNLDLFYEYLTFIHYMESISGHLTGSLTYMNFGEFIQTGENDPTELGRFKSFDLAATIGYATKLHPDWGLGMNFRLIHSRLSGEISVGGQRGEGSASSVSFDIGGMWRPGDLDIPLLGNIGNKFSVGANLSNLGPKIYYINKAQEDPIPTNFRLGFAASLMSDEFNSLIATVDFSKLLVTADTTSKDDFYKAVFTAWGDQSMSEELRDIVTSIGLEYNYGTPGDFMFSLRTGFFYEDPSYGNRKFATMGAGIKYQSYGFDFSYITTSMFKNGENHPLSETLRFTLSIGFGLVPTQSTGLPRGI